MIKTLHVALREFLATVLTKGFLLGVLMTPMILVIVGGGIALLKNLKGPTLVATVSVIDRTGKVSPGIVERFSPEAQEKERREIAEKVAQAAADQTERMGIPPQQAEAAKGMAVQAAQEATGKAELIVEVLPPDADAEKEKAVLAEVDVRSLSRRKNIESSDGPPPRVALAVIEPETLQPDPTGGFGEYSLYTAPRLDFEIQQRIESKIDQAVIDARVASDPRVAAAGLTPAQVRALLASPKARTATVTREGEKKGTGEWAMMVPMAFMLLLLMSVMTGGQYLLTTTVEEKSSRVMEVLLSAVSPLQLMLGKIIGQMCVGLVILVVYAGLGIGSLIVFSLQHLVSPMLLVYLLVFFFIAFFVVASMMAAAGSAVSELREAQTLMTPIMVIIMLPWLLWLPISRAPNSLFATVMSFVPGINPFVMMIRLTGSEPPPAWQIPVAILVGLATVVFCAWAAAKIFRVGVLLYGKPPNFRTLVKWVRMA